ncbi:glycosyltransferase [Algoriphagus sp. H41]|uniref:Glycosyltransferase n=1 Tax=Algoriphagus oliviformis TaxID=2811231 RepID=A0ABS3C197_9BACT|nr:glycosyltransferase [Algoriphagus oliviformis]MBN7809334.1 glycosyltransferase [Algoriphagus oliviformis]
MNPVQQAIPIIFNPSENRENQYIRILVEGIEQKGFAVNSLDDFLKSSAHFRSIRLVHLNWFENLDESSAAAMWKSFFRKVSAILLIKGSGKKLVWTMHNRLSHEKGSGKLSGILIKLLLKSVDAVVIHCGETETILKEIHPRFAGKILKVPHPHFIGAYGQEKETTSSGPAPLRLLFLGAVKPYKNLELLIRLCRELGAAVELTIAGKAASDAYEASLRHLSAGAESIKLRLGFVEDKQIPELIGASDLLVLPYDLRSSLNSGTALLAFSYGRTVICPRIGTIDELGVQQGEVFTYTYASESEHEAKLREAIAQACEAKQAESQSLLQRGKAMKEFVKRENDPSIAAAGLDRLYRELLS